MARKLIVEILGDASSLEKAFARSTKSAKTFDKSMSSAGSSTKRQSKLFGGLGKAAGLLGIGLGVGGLAGAAKAAFSEFADAQKVTAQTRAAIKSTGGAANVTADHVDALANSLLNLSGQDDEVIKSGENMLLTFTNVRNEVGKGNDIFDQATKTALDMSTALGTDMKQSALQLGKALNDPVKGIGALRRAGVSFTADQQNLIKKLVDTGHTMEAQKIILKELHKEFGGSAKAAGQTLGGQMDKLKNILLNLGASIAETLMPTVQKLLTHLNKWLQNSQNQKKVLDTVKQVVGALTTGIKVLTSAFGFLNKITGSTKHTLELLIAVVAGFKVLQFASRVKTVADNFGLLGRNAKSAGGAMTGARGSAAKLSGSLLAKGGLVAAVGVASYEISKLIFHLTGLDKKFQAAGGAAYDAAAKIGLVHDPNAQFKGKTILTGADAKFLQRRARALRRRGMSEDEIIAFLERTHPNLAHHDVEVIVHAALQRNITINGGVHLHGVPNVKQMEGELTKRAQARAHPRRASR